jgi:Arc/MetJ-type ribon-helix-helix transcriptional regulator
MGRRAKRKEDKMIITTLYLPPMAMEAIDALVEKGIYATRSEAIRGLLMEAIDEEMRLLGLLRPPADIPKGVGAKMASMTIKLPKGLLRIIDEEAGKMGVSRAEYVRTAVMHYMLRGVKR